MLAMHDERKTRKRYPGESSGSIKAADRM